MHQTGELWIQRDMAKNFMPLFYYKNALHTAASDDTIVKVNVVLINNPYNVQTKYLYRVKINK